jgi:hypothetical protein
MNQATVRFADQVSAPQPHRFRGPIWTLLLLAPFIAEVLSGSTRTSILFVYIPEVMVWGVGALLARELVRRWRAGGVSLLCLGLALSVAEEFLIQQTSLAPLPFPGSHPAYGRMFGINLVYFLFMLGFESVWVVVVPVQITELFFSQRSRQPWLRNRGIFVACIVFMLGCRIAWYGWTQQALKRMGVAPFYPSVAYLAAGVAAIGLLIALAYALRNFGQPAPADTRKTAPAWLVFIAAFVLGAAWFELIGQNFVPNPVQPFWIAVAAGVGWAALAFVLFVWWSSRPAWTSVHRFAAAFGATLACEAMPYFTFASWPLADRIGKVIFDVLALIGFALLARRIFAESQAG